MQRYAGLDWASDKHDVLVQEARGEEVLAASFSHDERGLSALCSTLVQLNVVLVAIERPDGLLIERLLDAGPRVIAIHPDPRSVVCAAALLAEIGDCRARYRSAEALAAEAGMSPIAVESGKRKVACFRRGCDHRLRTAIATLADATRHWHPWAADRYATARARGQDHQRAIRTLGRAWIRVIWRCWQDNIAYDPARHRGLQQHIAVTIPNGSRPSLDLPATQPMAGTAVTRRAARSAERQALDGKPTSATAKQG